MTLWCILIYRNDIKILHDRSLVVSPIRMTDYHFLAHLLKTNKQIKNYSCYLM